MQSFIFLALFVALLWAIAPILHKIAFKSGITPPTMMFVGSIFYFICMIGYSVAHRHTLQKEVKMLNIKAVAIIATASILTAFIANLVSLALIKRHVSYVVTAITFCSPIFTLILGYLVLKERVTILGVVGVLLVVCGILCLAFTSNNEKST